jgi:hypothetical protein
MQYPTDRPWSDARQLWEAADVVHLRQNFDVQKRLQVRPKPTVVHHHGTQFRMRPEPLIKEMHWRNVLGLAATLDLYLLAPDETVWLPAPYDIDWLQSLRQEQAGDDILRIAHAPTDRRIKSTAAFLRAVDKVREDVQVELILIERATWSECLKQKARADIYFDQVQLGYGNSAIESWGLGSAVICGAADDTLDEMTRRFGDLPFYLADEGTIYPALLALTDPTTRAAYAARGLHHIRRWHDHQRVVEQLQRIYMDAVERFGS